jgi:ubiquinone/menaquinone biosynthesis C-methylase UbiE
MNYQNRSYANSDERIRYKKADKIIAVLGDFIDLSKCDVLDIGTGSGYTAQDLARKSRSLLSIDVIDERKAREGYEFTLFSGLRLPFEDNKFDIVISNHVLEHVQNQKMHIEEMARVLKKGGVAYLATPNKLWFVESHYRLPFLSWLPENMANLYLKAAKGRSYHDIHLLFYPKLIKLVQTKFKIDDLSIRIIRDPLRYKVDIFPKMQFLFKNIPVKILEKLQFIFPSYILILRKR